MSFLPHVLISPTCLPTRTHVRPWVSPYGSVMLEEESFFLMHSSGTAYN